MLSWFAGKLIGYVMGQTRAGNIRPTLLLDASDVRFTFPGDNSWSGAYEGKEVVKRWLERLVAAGVRTFPDEVVATGFPWRSTVCIRGTDYVRTPEGETVYENRFVIWGHLRWGRLTDYEVYEDTIQPRALDAYLAQRGDAQAARALSALSAAG